MKYFVYLLITQQTTKPITYVGCTNNIKRRLDLHNKSKGAKFTRGRKWTLIYKKCYKSKSIALKNEYLLKKDRLMRKLVKDQFLKSL